MQDLLDNALELEVRQKIYSAIEEFPGLHFRELLRKTNLAVGSLQYHLEFLEKKHLIRVLKDKRFKRYYIVRDSNLEDESLVISFLRQEKPKQIILLLYSMPGLNQAQIASDISLGLSTTSVYLSRLVQSGIIKTKSSGRKKLFYLENPEKIKSVLVERKQSFLTGLVDNFAKVIEEL
ncbi:MAG: winged helix-turn-helix transcriptional regulator [archaeon]